MVRARNYSRIGVTVATTILLGACATSLAPSYSGPGPQNSIAQAERSGLTLLLAPMTDPTEQQKYFGTDLQKENIVPIWLKVSNNSAAGSYILNKQNVRFLRADTSGVTSYTASDVVGSSSLVLLSLGGALIADSMASNTAAITGNLQNKELKTSTIAPGASASGFIYVKTSNPAQPLRGTPVSIVLQQTGGGGNVEISAALN